ncbi:MAG: apolipoprotein N-acyltransferase [Burkholderiales bacterium]|nr:apolipoprotein N-acyltransferase [Burkholderiales bacterium]
MKGLAAAFAAGAAAVAGFAPLGLFAALLGALVALVELLISAASAARAAALGFAFGLGLFGAGVSWVYVSLARYGGMPAPLAALGTIGFCALLALFPAAAAWAEARLAGRAPRAARAALSLPAAWVLAEWLRGWLLTGFPWLSLGYAATDDPLAGFAPLGGVYAVSLALACAAGLLWCVARGEARGVALAALALLLGAGYALRLVEWTRPAGPPLAVALLQGNVPQELKFSESRYEATLRTYAQLAEESRARLIVLPETAVPRFLDRVDPAYVARLRAIAQRNGGDLLLGVPTRAGAAYFNSVVSLGVSPAQVYHKVHLVPFGEFVPPGFSWIVRVLSIPLSDFAAGSPAQPPLAVAGERVAVTICYEDAFGAELRRRLPEASLLVNVANVAWFGDSLAPAQHLQIARMRALESGRWHLTAANTGISAAIAPDGTVRATMPQFARGRVEAEVRGHAGATPWVRAGDAPAVALAALVLGACAVRARTVR